MRRRDMLTGAAALAAYGGLARDAEAITPRMRVLLSSATAGIPPGVTMPVFYTGLKARAAGTRNARVLCVGHSGVAGQGAGGNGQLGNAQAFSWPTIISGLLPLGSWQSRVGEQNVTLASFNAWDNRCVPGSWGLLVPATTAGPGGPYWRATAAATFSFTPTVSVDTFEYRSVDGSTATVNLNINGGSNTLVTTTSGGTTMKVSQISGVLGANTLNILWGSGSPFWNSIIATNSAVKETTVLNAGWCSGSTADLNANATYKGLSGATGFIVTWKPDLVVIQCMGNDVLAGTAIPAFTASTQTLITAAKNAGSDVLLIADWPQNTLEAASAPYRAVYASLAASNNCSYFDGFAFFGSWAAANAAGYMFDNFHLNGAGYNFFATMGIYPLLHTATGGLA